MKILKYVLLFLLVVIIGLAIYAAVQPSSYEITRSRVIEAPTALVYNNVNDYKNWEAWGPWLEEDPNMTFEYGNLTKGEGASYSWNGKDGPGSQKMVSAIPYESITTELSFEGMGSSTGYWKFSPSGDGTEVTWGMKADEVPYIFKFFGAISGGYDAMMGPMFERGLERLDSVLVLEAEAHEKLASTWSMGEISKVAVNAKNFIGYAHNTKIDQDVMSKIFQESMPKVGEYAMNQGLQYGDFTPGAIYTKWDEETGEADFMVGVFSDNPITPSEDMQSMSLPKGEVVMVSKFGNYGVGDMEAHGAIAEFMEKNTITMTGMVYELYMNDPMEVTPDKIQTDIHYPVK
ncbi:MAG: SRPBCC family protein [Bacteroidota bacterium]